jgi:hypothetical protein
MNGRLALAISHLVFVLGLLNFGIFMLECGYFGGTASRGKVEGGKFFLYNKSPREDQRYVPVSESVFRYCTWHEGTIMYTHLAAITAGANIYRIRNRRRSALAL